MSMPRHHWRFVKRCAAVGAMSFSALGASCGPSGACEVGESPPAPTYCVQVTHRDACDRDDSLRGGRNPGRNFSVGVTCSSLGYTTRVGNVWHQPPKD